MRFGGWTLIGLLVLTSAVRANGLDDANAGLAALNAGEFDHAISLMTRALASGQLRGDDLEFGFACRGRAYLKNADYSSAIVDLDRARRMKPDDQDAQGDLEQALAVLAPVSSIPGVGRGVTVSQARQAAGSQTPPRTNFWTGLRDALAGGAAAGVQQGLQDAAQDPQNPN